MMAPPLPPPLPPLLEPTSEAIDSQLWRLLPPPPRAEHEDAKATQQTHTLEEGIWRDTMARLILKLQDASERPKEPQGPGEAVADCLEDAAKAEQKPLDVARCAADAPKVNTSQSDADGSLISLLKVEDGSEGCGGVADSDSVRRVEAAMSAVAVAQAAAERQCARARRAELEAQQKEAAAVEKAAEAAREIARARAIIAEAQEARAATARLKATQEQMELEAEARKAELESFSAQVRRQEAQAAEEAQSKVKDQGEALEAALRAAELRAQSRLLDADALAESAEEKAKARARAAEAEAEAAERLAQTRVLAAEAACKERIGLAERAAEEDAAKAVSAWATLRKELPAGMRQRMLETEVVLQQGKKISDSAVDNMLAADALRRAREVHAKMESTETGSNQPAAAFVVTWGVVLALALDALLRLVVGTPCARRIEPDSPHLKDQPSNMLRGQCEQRHHRQVELVSADSRSTSLHAKREGENTWDHLSEVSYEAEVETHMESEAKANVLSQLPSTSACEVPDGSQTASFRSESRQGDAMRDPRVQTGPAAEPLTLAASKADVPKRAPESCQQHSLLQLKELQQEQLRELRNLKELQLQVQSLRLGERSETQAELSSQHSANSHSAGLGRFRAEEPEESLPITIGEVQRSVAIDRARLQEEMRALRLQQRLRRSAPKDVRGSSRPASPVRRTRTPSPQRPLYELPQPKRSSPSPDPRSRALPADVAARLSSSPALAAAAQHWGLPRRSGQSTPATPRRSPAPKAKAPKRPMQGVGVARGPFSPVRACHALRPTT
ncbi:unnamed protein product [Effrenium voratum]|uniref:Uncharacterized protein n=1 Tax=Effrenium voratum TaxID=2562239 RepID=A0AA36MWX0_9DINO|nr:unnamed protein product [Effrenium voratum]CAJ1441128.1 unnamed protein product [Effrenium voratum]